MRHIFEIDAMGRVEFSPQLLAIKEFNDLWEDRLPDSDKAFKEMALIFFFVDMRSPYIIHDEENRWTEILQDVMPDIKKWEPDSLIDDCIIKYRELTRTPSTDAYESALDSQREINKFLRGVDLNERDDKGKLVHNVKQIQDMQKAIPATIKSLQDAKRLVVTEMNEDLELQAGREKGEFEDAENNI